MRLKPKKVRNHGKVRWVVDDRDPLTGARNRSFFSTETAALAYQLEVNQRPTPTAAINPLLDPDIPLAPFAAEWLWSQIATGAWTRRGTINVYREHLARLCTFRLDATRTLGQVKVRDLTAAHVLPW